MRKHLKGFFIAAALLPAYQAWAQAEVPIEGATSFYVWQNDVPQVPGTVLRQEPMQPEFVLENAAQGVRILYVSRASSWHPASIRSRPAKHSRAW